jgi:hypothetical protein
LCSHRACSGSCCVAITANFDYTTVRLPDSLVQVAEREKAIVDGFDHPEYCGGVLEPAKGLWFGSDQLDLERLLERLVEYSRRLGNRAAMRRLGFWLERLEMGISERDLRRVAGRAGPGDGQAEHEYVPLCVLDGLARTPLLSEPVLFPPQRRSVMIDLEDRW